MLVYNGQIFDDGGVAGLHSGSGSIDGLMRDLDQASSVESILIRSKTHIKA
jgi:hypothetical protein